MKSLAASRVILFCFCIFSVLASGFWQSALTAEQASAWPLWLRVSAAGSELAAFWPLLLACIPALAICLDRVAGEPPMRWHPVAWMGHALLWLGVRIAPPAASASSGADWPAFWRGAAAWLAGAGLFAGAAWGLQAWLLTQPAWLATLALALCLKTLLAWAMLHDEVLAVEAALQGGLPAGRARLARLVSRDTAQLTSSEVRESAIESLAENLNDSVIAPLLWFVLLGLPGAALYRFANTADAMWGYRAARELGGVARQWEWAGKWAARADDALSWLPARLTAALLWLAAGRLALRRGRALAALPEQARQTPSPNSGWPMAAVALLLGVRLGKPGSYTLNPAGRAPEPADLLRACALGSHAILGAALLGSFALMALILA